jgi:hypothetical protein
LNTSEIFHPKYLSSRNKERLGQYGLHVSINSLGIDLRAIFPKYCVVAYKLRNSSGYK